MSAAAPAPAQLPEGDWETRSLLLGRVGDALAGPPVEVAAATSLRDALAAMKSAGTASALVRDGARLGLVTATNLRDAVILAGQPAESTRVGDLANWQLIDIGADAMLVDALAAMQRHEVRRLVVGGPAGPVGILEQVGLLSRLSVHSHVLSARLERAADLEALREVSQGMERLLRVLHDGGVRVQFIAHVASVLNRRLFARLFELTAPADLVANSCVLVLGSEGRGEQLLRTDQDNALILRDGYTRPDLPAICARVTESLVSLGYPPCPGGVMLSRPEWARPLSDYRDEFGLWVGQIDEARLMKLAIFMDAAPVVGDASLFRAARGALGDLLRGNEGAMARFAGAVFLFPPALGWLSRLRVEKGGARDGLMDLKKGGIFPLMHGVRSLALERRVDATSTFERIAVLVGQGILDRRFGAELGDTYDSLLGLRLAAGLAAPGASDHDLRPASLSGREHSLLVQSLRTVQRFKEIIRFHFRLDTFH